MINYARKLLVKSGCQFCRKTLRPVNLTNLKLPLNKRIEILDNYKRENFGINENPIVDRILNKKGDAYPTLFIDGVKVTGIISRNELQSFLDGFTENEKEIPEENKWLDS